MVRVQTSCVDSSSRNFTTNARHDLNTRNNALSMKLITCKERHTQSVGSIQTMQMMYNPKNGIHLLG